MLRTKPLGRSEVAVLETEHPVKVEALQALLLEVRIYMCPHTTIHVSSRRIYEHAVKVEALQALMLEVRHTTYYIYCVSSYYHIHTIYMSS